MVCDDPRGQGSLNLCQIIKQRNAPGSHCNQEVNRVEGIPCHLRAVLSSIWFIWFFSPRAIKIISHHIEQSTRKHHLQIVSRDPASTFGSLEVVRTSVFGLYLSVIACM